MLNLLFSCGLRDCFPGFLDPLQYCAINDQCPHRARELYGIEALTVAFQKRPSRAVALSQSISVQQLNHAGLAPSAAQLKTCSSLSTPFRHDFRYSPAYEASLLLEAQALVEVFVKSRQSPKIERDI
jgi:hypothetical protein